jgi:HK97 family phage prohead protease
MAKKVQHITLRSDVKLEQGEDGRQKIIGLIPYNTRSEFMGFYEFIQPTAFNKTLADGADVKALYDHDSSKVLARVKNGSLVLRNQDDGLYCEATLPDTTYARDAYNLIRDGYVQTMSFGFTPIKEKVVFEDGNEVRYLTETKLSEVSFCVPFPAYETTDSLARSIRGIDLDKIASVLEKDSLIEEDFVDIKSTISILQNLLPKEEPKVEVQENISAVIDTEAVAQAKALNTLLEGLKELNKN